MVGHPENKIRRAPSRDAIRLAQRAKAYLIANCVATRPFVRSKLLTSGLHKARVLGRGLQIVVALPYDIDLLNQFGRYGQVIPEHDTSWNLDFTIVLLHVKDAEDWFHSWSIDRA